MQWNQIQIYINFCFLCLALTTYLIRVTEPYILAYHGLIRGSLREFKFSTSDFFLSWAATEKGRVCSINWMWIICLLHLFREEIVETDKAPLLFFFINLIFTVSGSPFFSNPKWWWKHSSQVPKDLKFPLRLNLVSTLWCH